MNNFKKIDDTNFFIVVEMPLYEEQCQRLYDLLDAKIPNTIVDVSQDSYGSFKVEIEEGVAQTDELYESIWEAGEDLFVALYEISGEMWAGIDVNEDLEYYVDSYVEAHRRARYDIDHNTIRDEFIDYWEADGKAVEKILFLNKLREAA